MAFRRIITIADPILYKKSAEVTQFNAELRELIRDMFDTLYKGDGVGLAAVQIGVLKQVIVYDLKKQGFTKGVIINPKILQTSPEMIEADEGCLSVPGVSALLERPQWVKIRYQNLSGAEHILEGEYLMARMILHEMDHLNGEVFIDKLKPEYKKLVKNDVKMIKKGKLPLKPAETVRSR